MSMIYESFSESDTGNIATKLGKDARSDQVYSLVGDLGVGKTVFTQGFARGLGVTEVVNSPTFTIVQEYTTGSLPLYHFDAYRIGDPLEMYDVGYEDYIYNGGVCLIEWGNLIEDILPEDVIKVTITKDLDKGFDYRRIEVESGESE